MESRGQGRKGVLMVLAYAAWHTIKIASNIVKGVIFAYFIWAHPSWT